ncbi:MAG: polysaccharide deacetylase family protein, partial [bacterium]
DKPRHIEFGLQASPTKPMPSDWRSYDVPGGGGMPVVVWGGFNCSSKYPVEKEWGLVDKIVAGRGSGKVDDAYFKGIEEKYKLKDATANGEPWIKSVLQFAGKEATNPHPNGTTVYFEEHQTNGNHPEMVEYMDEWADTTWSRFRYFEYSGFQEGKLQKGTWGPEVRSANALSYQDFAVYTASQWMERGVGIYYDNTYPMVDYNRIHFGDKGINWSGSLWGHRAYYKRVWKRSRELMEKGLTPLDPLYSKTDPTRRMRLNIVGHITNCQVLPYTTWFDATLGVESPGQWIPDKMLTDEQKEKSLKEWSFVMLPTPNKDTPGTALPYPPDYLRAMEMGRMGGLIPHYRHLLRSEDAFGGIGIGFGATDQGKDKEVREHRYLSDTAMGLIHEIRGGASGYDHPQVGALRRTFSSFGYGKTDVKVYNYWDEKPYVSVSNPQVKWLAMTREAKMFGLLLLQSYSQEAAKTSIKFPDGTFFVDALTREQFTVNNKGEAEISFLADYGTRILLIAKRQQDITLMPMTPQTLFVDDFELGLGPQATIKGGAVTTIDDTLAPGNHVLHLLPAHPAQNIFSTLTPVSDKDGDYTASFKFRLTEKPKKAGKQGLIRVGYRHLNNMRYGFEICANISPDGKISFFSDAPRLCYDGGKSQPMQVSHDKPDDKILGNQNLEATDWHVMLIRVIGKRHQLAIDGNICFEGEDDTCLTGSLELAPGWGLSSNSPVTSVDIDKVWIQKTTEDKQLTVTSSWDDGHKNDVKLAALLRKYDAKGTFFIYPENYVLYTKDPDAGLKKDPFLIIPHEEFIKTYKGLEIGAHGFQHPDMRKLKPEELEYQLTESKKVLEEWFKTTVSGMAYPGGAYNDDVKAAVKKAGYKYARTVESASTISPTDDPYALKVSLKYSDPSFWKEAERVKVDGGVFYFWGHSYEISSDDDWRDIEDKIARLSADPLVKWVTNGELFNVENKTEK